MISKSNLYRNIPMDISSDLNSIAADIFSKLHFYNFSVIKNCDNYKLRFLKAYNIICQFKDLEPKKKFKCIDNKKWFENQVVFFDFTSLYLNIHKSCIFAKQEFTNEKEISHILFLIFMYAVYKNNNISISLEEFKEFLKKHTDFSDCSLREVILSLLPVDIFHFNFNKIDCSSSFIISFFFKC